MKPPRTAIEKTEWMRNLLAFLLVGSFISVFPALTLYSIPEANRDIVTYMVGQLSGMATTVLGFYFINKVGQDALDATRATNTGKAFEAVTSALKTADPGTGEPQQVEVVNEPNNPVPTTEGTKP